MVNLSGSWRDLRRALKDEKVPAETVLLGHHHRRRHRRYHHALRLSVAYVSDRTMCRLSNGSAGWSILVMALLSLLFNNILLITSEPIPDQSDNSHLPDMVSTCHLRSNWSCRKQKPGPVSLEVVEVCETCGRFWANILGLTYCCRCNSQVFAFCWQAVKGKPLSLYWMTLNNLMWYLSNFIIILFIICSCCCCWLACRLFLGSIAAYPEYTSNIIVWLKHEYIILSGLSHLSKFFVLARQIFCDSKV